MLDVMTLKSSKYIKISLNGEKLTCPIGQVGKDMHLPDWHFHLPGTIGLVDLFIPAFVVYEAGPLRSSTHGPSYACCIRKASFYM